MKNHSQLYKYNYSFPVDWYQRIHHYGGVSDIFSRIEKHRSELTYEWSGIHV